MTQLRFIPNVHNKIWYRLLDTGKENLVPDLLLTEALNPRTPGTVPEAPREAKPTGVPMATGGSLRTKHMRAGIFVSRPQTEPIALLAL